MVGSLSIAGRPKEVVQDEQKGQQEEHQKERKQRMKQREQEVEQRQHQVKMKQHEAEMKQRDRALQQRESEGIQQKEKLKLELQLEKIRRGNHDTGEENDHSNEAGEPLRVKIKGPSLPQFDEKHDDLGAYLRRFYLFAKATHCPKEN